MSGKAKPPGFSEGDIVRTKAGGPVMIVLDELGGQTIANCGWWDAARVIESAFPVKALRIATEDEIERAAQHWPPDADQPF